MLFCGGIQSFYCYLKAHQLNLSIRTGFSVLLTLARWRHREMAGPPELPKGLTYHALDRIVMFS